MIKSTSSTQWVELSIVLLFAFLTMLFFWDGRLDMALANYFYRPDHPTSYWPVQQYWLWQVLYDIGNPLITTLLVTALGILLFCLFKQKYRKYSSRAGYFILVVVLGPGLIVNLVLKDHWGRPRPRDIIEFKGQYAYQAPLVISDTGQKSFVCGHCSVGYLFFSFYFILQKGRMLALLFTLSFSLLMSIGRMTAGGHFVSDILWSGYVVFFISWFLCYYIFKEFKSTRLQEY